MTAVADVALSPRAAVAALAEEEKPICGRGTDRDAPDRDRDRAPVPAGGTVAGSVLTPPAPLPPLPPTLDARTTGTLGDCTPPLWNTAP